METADFCKTIGMTVSSAELSTLSTSAVSSHIRNWVFLQCRFVSCSSRQPSGACTLSAADHWLYLKVKMSYMPDQERYLALDDVLLKPHHLIEVGQAFEAGTTESLRSLEGTSTKSYLRNASHASFPTSYADLAYPVILQISISIRGQRS